MTRWHKIKRRRKLIPVRASVLRRGYVLGTLSPFSLPTAWRHCRLPTLCSHLLTEQAPDSYLGDMWRARTHSAMDPETTEGLAKPYYEKVVDVLLAKTNRGTTLH